MSNEPVEQPPGAWRESLDAALTARLTRALVQPGSVSMRTVRRIFGWLEHLERRRALAADVVRRWTPAEPSRSDDVPIVYARWTDDVGTEALRGTATSRGAPAHEQAPSRVEVSTPHASPLAPGSVEDDAMSAGRTRGDRALARQVVRAERIATPLIEQSAVVRAPISEPWKVARPTRVDPEKTPSDPAAGTRRPPMGSRLLQALSFLSPEKPDRTPAEPIAAASERTPAPPAALDARGAQAAAPAAQRPRVRPTPYVTAGAAPLLEIATAGEGANRTAALPSGAPGEKRVAPRRVVAPKEETTPLLRGTAPLAGRTSEPLLPRVQPRPSGEMASLPASGALPHTPPPLGAAPTPLAAAAALPGAGGPTNTSFRQGQSSGAALRASGPVFPRRAAEARADAAEPLAGGATPVLGRAPVAIAAALGDVDIDSLVDKVQRSLLRQLSVERERKGGRR